MPYKSYRFFDSYELRVSWTSNGASKSITKDIVWDEDKTKVVSAKLRGRIYASGGTNARLSFNGNEVIFCGAPIVDNTVEDTVDITGILINGSNACLAEVWKIFYYPKVTVLHYKGAASRQRSFRSIYEFYRAMYLFHNKHYRAKTFFLLNWIIVGGIVALGALALLRNALRPASRRRVASA